MLLTLVGFMFLFGSLEIRWEPLAHNNYVINMRSISMVVSFSTPQGIILWAARVALRNMLLRGGLLSFKVFLGTWIRTLPSVASWEPLSHLSSVFKQFHSAMSHLLHHGSLITHIVLYQPDPLSDEDYRDRKQRTIARTGFGGTAVYLAERGFPRVSEGACVQ